MLSELRMQIGNDTQSPDYQMMESPESWVEYANRRGKHEEAKVLAMNPSSEQKMASLQDQDSFTILQ